MLAVLLLSVLGVVQVQSGPAQPSAHPAIAQGQELYGRYCAQCHQANGRGLPGRFPPLVGSRLVSGHPEILLRILLNGLQGPVQVGDRRFDGVMPANRDQLSDQEIAALATFIRQWGSNSAPAVSPETVNSVRLATASRRGSWTAAELRSGLSESWLFVIGLAILVGILALWTFKYRRQD